MSGRNAKLIRRASKYNKIEVKVLKQWYKTLSSRRKRDFRVLEGRLITLTDDYINQLKLGIFPKP